ncbi:50S ribosomal protein L25 [Candidatus Poribacteria bacterium]|nr:50S ribosomal protein L25 [Candidatus Poribacteria bacterium]
MQQVRLDAEHRTAHGSAAARRARRAGKVPGVLYGSGGSTTPIQIDSRDLHQLLMSHAEHALIALHLDGTDTPVVLRELQRNSFRRELLHADFLRVRMDTEITMDVNLTLEGEAPGVDEGGILEFLSRTLHIRALPANIPEGIHIDISQLGMGASVHVRDLEVPDTITVLTDPDTVLVTVATPRVETVETAVEEGAEESSEPEVVGRRGAAEDDE